VACASASIVVKENTRNFQGMHPLVYININNGTRDSAADNSTIENLEVSKSNILIIIKTI
jgi:hypothetical protein